MNSKYKIYTKGGDKGKTSLVGGQRVNKYDLRIESYGTIDELNSFIGLLISRNIESKDKEFLIWIQNKLFSVGGYLATDTTKNDYPSIVIEEQDVNKVEKEIDYIDEILPELRAFILPCGGEISSLAHICRTICRRAERRIYKLNSTISLETNMLKFINRLSDYFFNLARKETLKENSGKEILWQNK